MKKLSNLAVGLLCLLQAQQVHAQYNKTYPATINGTYTQTSRRGKVVDAGNGDVAILINEHNNNANSINLRKLDFNGLPLFSTTHHTSQGVFIDPYDMIMTPNGEYIVAGYYVIGVRATPFIARFDASGNVIWSNAYGTTPTQLWPRNGYADLDICHADDAPGSDEYMLVASCQPSYYNTTAFKNDVAIHAMRFRGNGTVIWSNKYNLSIPARGTKTTDWHDNPATICYGSSGGVQKYYIGGNAEDYGGFEMSINPAGAIVDNYKQYALTKNTYDHDAIFDQQMNRFVVSCGVAHNSISPSPVIGQLVVMNMPFTGLPIHYEFYYHPSVETHFAKSIHEDATHTAYIIASDMAGDHNLPGFSYNMGILKIDKNFTQVFLKRYDKFRYSEAACILSHKLLNLENYVLLGDRTSSTGNIDMRVISANVGGVACGEEDLTVNQTGADISNTTESYIVTPYGLGTFPFALNALIDILNPDSCNAAGVDPNYYRPTSVNNLSLNNDMQVYPTVFDGENNNINFEWYTDNTTRYTATVYSIDGKKILTQDFTSVTGANKISIPLTLNVPGTYLLSVQATNRSVNKTIRITRN